MLLDNLIDQWCVTLQVERGHTLKTYKSYKSRARAFPKYLISTGHDQPTLDDFNTVTLTSYLYHLDSSNFRPRTVRVDFHPLRAFGDWCVVKGHLVENPARAVDLPKLDAAERDYVNDDDVRALIAACCRQADPRLVAQSRAVISVLAYAGLRRQELIDLRVSDIDLVEKRVIVRQGKGRKRRELYPYQDCIVALREWLAVRPRDCTHDWLWAHDKSRRMADDGLRTMIRQIAAIAGLTKPVLPHSIRHNCATRLMRGGADLESIRVFLGHAHLSTTAIYLHTDLSRQREIAKFGGLDSAEQNPASDRFRSDSQPVTEPVSSRSPAQEVVKVIKKAEFLSVRRRTPSR